MSLTESLLRPLRSASARPLFTHYDDSDGSRIELSVATLANWAAKTANWLVEEADVEPGDPVAVALPAHWQTAGVLLGAWWCGTRVVPDSAGARVAFVPPDTSPAGAEAVAVVALDPLGRGLGHAPGDGAVDFLSDARLSGDDFTPMLPIPPATPALLDSTVDEVLSESRATAQRLGIGPSDRVLSTVDWVLPDGVIRGLLAPLAAGASIVQVANADPAKLDDRRRAERTTLDL